MKKVVGCMTSNMAECFNSVLEGVCALHVMAIIQYTFHKLNVYFLEYSMETDKKIDGMKQEKEDKYPPRVDKWL
jgi:hypothetical protein